MLRKFFTSESVTEGHPDKICDQISDAVLDAILTEDPTGRVACETVVTTGLVLVTGEFSTHCHIDIPRIVRNTVRQIGYDNAEFGFDSETCSVITSIDEQSPDIAMGVNKSLEAKNGDEAGGIGAGDQGMMFGFACDETSELMPMPISLAHKLVMRLSEVRKNGTLAYLRPDGKSQVTVEYVDDKPVRVDTVVISTQHSEDIACETLTNDIIQNVIRYVIPAELLDSNTKYLVNPTGRFVVGGPKGDSGLTGRKIIVDTYGGYSRHGGGAFSGKDPTKVDRSAAYAARYVAKNVVAAGLARKCEVQLAYAIGVAKPVSILVNTFKTESIPEETISNLILRYFDLRPDSIMKELKLRRPIYRKTATFGHFGRNDEDFTWERTDKAELLKKAARDLLLDSRLRS